MADATGATVDNEAELVAASARFSCPLASSYLAVSVQDLMAADTPPDDGAPRAGDEGPRSRRPSHLASVRSQRGQQLSNEKEGHRTAHADDPGTFAASLVRAVFLRLHPTGSDCKGCQRNWVSLSQAHCAVWSREVRHGWSGPGDTERKSGHVHPSEVSCLVGTMSGGGSCRGWRRLPACRHYWFGGSAAGPKGPGRIVLGLSA